jgi:hypothetical protein
VWPKWDQSGTANDGRAKRANLGGAVLANSAPRVRPPTQFLDRDPRRRMVAGLLPATDVTIDTGVDELAGNGRAQQTMIDPQAGARCQALGAGTRQKTEVGNSLMYAADNGVRINPMFRTAITVDKINRLDIAVRIRQRLD